MKNIIYSSAGILLLFFTGCAAASMSPVAITKPSERLQVGDSIIVDSVSASSFPLQVGDRVLIRGHYTLQSRRSAVLALFLSPDRTAERFPPTQEQQTYAKDLRTLEIATGSGAFALECSANGGETFQISLIGDKTKDTFGSTIFKLAKPQKTIPL